MTRKIISLLLTFVLVTVPLLSVNAIFYFPGAKTYVMEDKYLKESENVTVSGNSISVSGTGSVMYDYYISFDVGDIEIKYTGESEGSVTLKTDILDTQTKNLDASKDNIKFTLSEAQRAGDHILELSFKGEMTITAITLYAKGWNFGFQEDTVTNWVPADMNDSEWAIHTAFMVNTKSSIVMVNGSRRFIDENNMEARPLNIDGTTYLPIKVLAYGLQYYHEDMPHKNYFLMRYEQTTYTYKDGVLTKQIGHGDIETIKAPVQFVDGKTYLPIRFFAEEAGKTVLFKDGIIVIEDSRHLAEQIINDKTNFEYVKSEFAPFTEATSKGTTYHVSVNGNDANDGSEGLPFKTIQKAADVASAGDTVIIHGGTYREFVTVKNDGTATSPIIFKEAEGENAVITATEEVKDFVNMGDGTMAASVPWDLGRGKNQVFYKNECIVEARYPNGPGVEMSEGRELSSLYPVVGDFYLPDLDTDGTSNTSYVTSETLLNQEEDDYWKGATYVSAHSYAWTLLTGIVESSTKGSLRINKEDRFNFYWNYSANKSDKLDFGYLTGHRNAMDIPGEWIMEDNVMSIIPPEGETAGTLKVEVKQRQLCLDMSGRKYVQIKGLDFFGGSIKMTDSEMCVLDNIDAKYTNHFIHNLDAREGFIDDYSASARMSGDGAILRGETGIFISGTDNYVINSRIDHGAGAGLVLAGVYAYVENNIISNTGYMGTYVSGINVCIEPHKPVATPRGGHGIYHNTVYNAGRSVYNVYTPEGMLSVMGAKKMWDPAFLPIENAYNDFHDGVLFTLDTGITYEYSSLARTERAESDMHHNYVYGTTPYTTPYTLALYHDGNTIGYGTYNNIAFTTEPDTMFSHAYVYKSASGATKANFVRRNMELYKEPVAGGPENLTAEQFPYNQPFYAGAYQGAPDFMKNYNDEANSSEIYFAKDAVLGGGAEVDEFGRVVLKKKGDYIEFKNIDMTEEGKNVISYYYSADGLAGTPFIDIGFGENVDNARYNITSTDPRAPKKDELDVDYATFAGETGVTNMFIRFNKGTAIAIDSVVLRKNEAKVATLDPKKVYAGLITRVSKVGAGVVQPHVQDSPAAGGPYLNDTWAGNQVTYSKITIPEDAKYIYYGFGTAKPYHGTEIIFSYYQVTDPSNTEFARGVSVDNGWNTFDDYYYIKLPDDMPLGEEADIVVDFAGPGSGNFYSFGFVSELPENAKIVE